MRSQPRYTLLLRRALRRLSSDLRMRPEDERVFEAAVGAIREEGRYRVFADIMRERGRFPHARLRTEDGAYHDIVVWCSNDYLGQGQSPEVLDAAHAALDKV